MSNDLFGAAERKGKTSLKVASRSSSAEAGYITGSTLKIDGGIL